MNLAPSFDMIFLFAVVNLPQVVLFHQVFPIPRILAVFFFCYTIVTLYRQGRHLSINRFLKPFLSLWAAFLCYLFIVDIHHDGLSDAIRELLKNVCFLMTFIAFLNIDRKTGGLSKRSLFFALTLIFSTALAIGLIQMALPDFTFHKLLDFRPVVYQPVENKELTNYLVNESRLTGPYNISTGYSLLIGFIAIYYASFFLYTDDFKKPSRLLLLFTLLLSYFTHTRSLTFGLIPSIIVSKYLLERKVKSLTICLMALLIFLSLNVFLVLPRIQTINKRAAMVFDSNTAFKTLATIYGTIGALYLNPIIGIPRNDNYKAIKIGARISNLRIFPAQSLVDTNHNQIAYYIKYYGLLGFSLFFVLNIHLIKILIKLYVHEKQFAFIAFGNYIYLMQFSLFHNNFLFNDFAFWSLTGLFISHVSQTMGARNSVPSSPHHQNAIYRAS